MVQLYCLYTHHVHYLVNLDINSLFNAHFFIIYHYYYDYYYYFYFFGPRKKLKTAYAIYMH